jgi:hypothetical protein
MTLGVTSFLLTPVHDLKLAAVDGNAGLRQQAHLAAQLDELRANLFDRGPSGAFCRSIRSRPRSPFLINLLS